MSRVSARAARRRARTQPAGEKDFFRNLGPRDYPGYYKPTRDEIEKYDLYTLYRLFYGESVEYFDSPVFDEARRQEREELDSMIRDVEVEESIYTCPRCHSKKIRVRPVQDRAGDESQSVRYVCVRCRYGWKVSR